MSDNFWIGYCFGVGAAGISGALCVAFINAWENSQDQAELEKQMLKNGQTCGQAVHYLSESPLSDLEDPKGVAILDDNGEEICRAVIDTDLSPGP